MMVVRPSIFLIVCCIQLVALHVVQAILHDSPTLSPLCGGNLTVDDAELQSPGYPHPSPEGEMCLWTIFAQEGEQIFLKFDKFDMDGPGDVVEVYDVYNVSDRVLVGSFSGNKDRFMVISVGKMLQVNFTSSLINSTYLQRRFHATFTTKGCFSLYHQLPSGSLSTPIYDTKSMPWGKVMTCTWQIDVSEDHKMALTFDDTLLGNRSSLEVRDGFDVKAPLLANYSGNWRLPDVISTQNQVFVNLTFDLGSPPNVHATFIQVSSDCSGRIQLSETYNAIQIQSPKYPLPYLNNLDCRWLVESTITMTTLVAITTSYNVSDDNDVLTVKDGGSRSSNQLWTFVGSLQDEDLPWLVSSGQSLWLKFTSDESDNQGYFSINISAQDSGGLVTDNTDLLFPASVPSTVYQCVAPEDSQCALFRSYWNCTFDDTQSQVSIYEGQRPDEDMLVHRYDATDVGVDEPTPAFANGKMMLVVAEHLGNGGNCEGELRMIAADSYQHAYGPSGSRVQSLLTTVVWNGWVIHPDLSTGSLLKISILQLDLIDREWIEISQVSANGETEELMSIYQEWNGALTVYVWPISPVSIVYYDLPIVANRTAVYSISYTMLTGCGGIHNVAQHGYITSPEYPSTYPLNALCTWEITVKENHLLHVIFEELHIADNHYVSLTSLPTSGDVDPSDMKFSGSVRPNDVIVSSNELWVKFNSTARFTYPDRGFKIYYQAIDCGGHMTANEGTLKTPHYPANITQNTTCMWIVDLPTSTDKDDDKPIVVQLTFNRQLLDEQNYPSNWFEIRDGPNFDSDLLQLPENPKNATNISANAQILSRTSRIFVSYLFHPNSPTEIGFPFSVKYSTYTCDQKCDNGLCLHESWRCDGIDQCGDNTDEQGCSNPIPNCKSIPVDVVPTWALAVSVVCAILATVAATLLTMVTVRRYRAGQGFGGDRTLLVQED